MSVIAIRRRDIWTQQPPYATRVSDFWRAQGLVFAHNPAVGDFNLVSGAAALNASGFPRDIGPSGVRLNLAGASKAEFADSGLAAAGNSLTIISIWRAKDAQYSSGDATRVLLSTRTAGNAGWGWGRSSAIAGGANGNLTGQFFVLNGVAQYNEGNNTIESLVDTVVACRVAGTVCSWFRNGKKSSTDTTVGTASTGTRTVLGAGGPYSAPSTQWNDRAYLTLAFNKPLSDAYIALLCGSVNAPWQVFPQPPRWLFASAPAGGSIAAAGGATADGVATPSAQVALAAIGVSIANGAAAAAASIPLSAAGISVSSGSANPTATVTISAAALAQAAGQAGLSASVLLAAAAAAQAAGNAVLSAQLNALASGAALASGTANLSGGAPGALNAAGQSQANGSAVLSINVNLVATGAAQASGAANGTASAPGALNASGAALAGGTATWSALVTLTAAGFVQAMGAGAFNVQVPLAASGQAVAGGHAGAALGGQNHQFRLAASVARVAALSHGTRRVTSASAAVRRTTTLHHEVRHA